LAIQFRKKYSSDENGAPNVNAFFIGVFDTVASLGSYRVGTLATGGLLIALAVVSFVQSFFCFRSGQHLLRSSRSQSSSRQFGTSLS